MNAFLKMLSLSVLIIVAMGSAAVGATRNMHNLFPVYPYYEQTSPQYRYRVMFVGSDPARIYWREIITKPLPSTRLIPVTSSGTRGNSVVIIGEPIASVKTTRTQVYLGYHAYLESMHYLGRNPAGLGVLFTKRLALVRTITEEQVFRPLYLIIPGTPQPPTQKRPSPHLTI